MRRLFVILAGMALLGAVVVVLVRNQPTPAVDDRLQVAASFYPLYNFAQIIGGDKVHVVNVTPAGAEPHDYEPSPRDIVQALRADVFIYNGAGMEPWVPSFLQNYKHEVIKGSSGIPLHQATDPEETKGEPAQQGKDPHYWLDPIFADQLAATITQGLIRADPTHKNYYQHRAARLHDQLLALDQAYREGLTTCQTQTIVTSHQAFGYVAQRYGLTPLAIAGLSTDSEPSAAKLAELTDIVRTQQIKYVFFEGLVGKRLSDTIAKETGAKTLAFDPIEGLTDADQKRGKDYLTIQQDNLANLRTALACQ